MQSTWKILLTGCLSLLIPLRLHASSSDISRQRAEAIVKVPWRVVKVVHRATGDHQPETKLTLLAPNEDVVIVLTFPRNLPLKTTGITPEYVRFVLNDHPDASRYQVSRYLIINRVNSNMWYLKKESDEARALRQALYGWGGKSSQPPSDKDLHLDTRERPKK